MNHQIPEAHARPWAEAPAAEAPAGTTTADAVALQQELEKWRGRVSRLLAALKERHAEVERLQRELTGLRAGGGAAARESAGDRPGAQAREAVIGELERELADLREAHAVLQGDLHARGLTIGGLKRDLQGWKDKWHALARQLDGAASAGDAEQARVADLSAANARLTRELATLRSSLAEVAEERDALAARNANLFETTGLANRQMEVLADDLAELRGEVKSLRLERAQAAAELGSLRAERTEFVHDLAAARRDVEHLEGLLQTLQAASMALGADLRAADQAGEERLAGLAAERDALAAQLAATRSSAEALESALAQAEQSRFAAERACSEAERARSEAERVRARTEAALRSAEDACASADRARVAAEAAQGRSEEQANAARAKLDALLQQTGPQRSRLQQLEFQLQERSALVRGLEQELIGRDQRIGELEAGRTELEAELARVTRNAREHADFVQQLDGRLERQKELLLSLEQELSTTQEREAAAARRHEIELAARDGEIRALQAQLGALRSAVPASSDGEPLLAGGARLDPAALDRDTRTLRVLHQQLRDALARNDALQVRMRELEQRMLLGSDAQAGDDLTRIRGVGPRLAQHLQELGVRRYEQIAELDPQTLDDPGHALAALRSRILRDGWIEQAAELQRH
jgi:predicted flap endonuclease-1-like 5' DNA nuclease